MKTKSFVLWMLAAVFFLNTGNAFSQDEKTILSNGIDQYWEGEYELAIGNFNAVILANAKNAEAYCYRGMCYRDLKQLDKAFPDFNKAIALDPKYGKAYYERGMCYIYKNDSDNSIEDFTMAINNGLKTQDVYYYRGYVRFMVGKTNDAISDFTSCIALDPKNSGSTARAHNSRGYCYETQNKNDLALADYNKALTLNNTLTVAMVNRGNLYYKTGKKDLAKKDWQDAAARGDEQAKGNLKKYFNE